ncbi:hypothetical protein [Undibacterium sp.]|uniref:hypothetical protein n=1 Tax=Undibacterium sp. TaxID=1914977 RepID=UPI0037533310
MQVFPTIVRKSNLLGIPVLAIPVLLAFVTTLYWIGRTLLKRKVSTSKGQGKA